MLLSCAHHRLGDIKLTGWSVKLEAHGSSSRSCRWKGTRIPHGSEEEVGELVASSTASGRIRHGGVGQVEVHVAVRVLMGWGGENVRSVVVKAVDCPLQALGLALTVRPRR